ncbi:hypothetical protein [Sorangium sp. So ce233]|uniref:hypothetical protein n=1 Tax=Sorangium sp. So ce233 TaxID=3133290 RepID=UPI003F5F8887
MSRVPVMLSAVYCLRSVCALQSFMNDVSWMTPEKRAHHLRRKFSDLEIVAAAAGLALVENALVRALRESQPGGPR